jgi:hypothetical protein
MVDFQCVQNRWSGSMTRKTWVMQITAILWSRLMKSTLKMTSRWANQSYLFFHNAFHGRTSQLPIINCYCAIDASRGAGSRLVGQNSAPPANGTLGEYESDDQFAKHVKRPMWRRCCFDFDESGLDRSRKFASIWHQLISTWQTIVVLAFICYMFSSRFTVLLERNFFWRSVFKHIYHILDIKSGWNEYFKTMEISDSKNC